jgi:hypothetical protein
LKSAALKGPRTGLRSKKEFNQSKVGRFIKRIDKALPGKHTLSLYNGLSREEATALTQLRSGIGHFNDYLAKIKQNDSPAYECGAERETVEHFLLHYPRWMEQRKDLRRAAGIRWGDLSFLLGGWSGDRSGSFPDGRLQDRKPDKTVVAATLRFTQETGRLLPNTECSQPWSNNVT